MQLRLQCPHCGHIESYDGTPGTRIVVSCLSCGQQGQISFPFNHETAGVPAIEVSNLKKQYGTLTAVNGISFTVQQGEIFAFLGPNGAGKTTTVEMIESIRKPTQGQVKILGKDINTSFDEIKHRIGILPQEFKSFERLTVRETLEYFSVLYDKSADIDEILKAMDLVDQRKKLYGNLSGGLKQRVGVAISLVNDPDIVFLDEPTTGLDPKARREVWQVIANLRNRGKTVFLTTHYMEEAEYLADHIAIIHKGNIIAEGSLDDLISRYGKGNVLRIRNCSTQDAIETLRINGFDVISEGNGDIAIPINYKERVLEILSQLRHDCIEYDSIDIRRSNLEEVFLTLT
ncbi:MAG: ATP-binding cassette domain-containing protein [Candidatus Thermoplasmatota archaeon]|nr:ATP-binding cassette domain-containing protein [Candidatus Thermoplasmatota archaeon]